MGRMTGELWAEVLKKLPSVQSLCSARATCLALRDAYKDDWHSICEAMLTATRVEPYTDVRSCTSQAHFAKTYEAARHLRESWKKGSGAQSLFPFSSFVRSVRVDWQCGTLAAGLYDGTVTVLDLEHRRWCVEVAGAHKAGQVLAVDISSNLLVSVSGEPSYHESTCARATLRVVRLDFDDAEGRLAPTGAAVGQPRRSSPCAMLRDATPVHELGAAQGGHTDSINAVRIVELGDAWPDLGSTALSSMPPQCVSASSDTTLIVWDLRRGKPLRTLRRHQAAVTAIALKGGGPGEEGLRVGSGAKEGGGGAGIGNGTGGGTGGWASPRAYDSQHVYSCSHDGVILEWNWRRGDCVRCVLSASVVEPRPLTTISFHSPTSTLAVGSQLGDVCILRANPSETRREGELPSYPLTAWHAVGLYSSGGGPRPSPRHEVACVQHDGDKLVTVARSGELQVRWLGQLPDEGEPFGCYDERSVLRESADKKPLKHASARAACQRVSAIAAAAAEEGSSGVMAAMSPVRFPKAPLSSGVRTNVRLYVSSVMFRGGVLVADGFDNQVLRLRLGSEPPMERGAEQVG